MHLSLSSPGVEATRSLSSTAGPQREPDSAAAPCAPLWDPALRTCPPPLAPTPSRRDPRPSHSPLGRLEKRSPAGPTGRGIRRRGGGGGGTVASAATPGSLLPGSHHSKGCGAEGPRYLLRVTVVQSPQRRLVEPEEQEAGPGRGGRGAAEPECLARKLLGSLHGRQVRRVLG